MIGNSWDDILKDEFKKDYFKDLVKFLNLENKAKTIFPKSEDLFRALKLTDYKDVNVVILGQDPYHGEKEANGLCFSVNHGVQTPPSLQNIFKELKNDLNITRTDTDLSDWAEQGILLLNTVLTVEKDKAFSHRGKGWEVFTDKIIEKLNEKEDPIVFVLWGNAARSKKVLLTNKKHMIVESAHPSPLSYNKGFKNSKPFSKINALLKSVNKNEIKW
ncbi:MAG: uracil-DNA glycosylase [Bacilli bacterium]|nr:uracil-DNA glycosylase [Bacilli bacterium]MBQ6283071.1 uracil-DNA glycosylase [Bacilli bacterium]